MTNAFTKEDFNSRPKEDGDRFYEFAYESPTELYIYLHLRLIPKLNEFEEPKSKDGNGWVVSQLKRWLTTFQL